MNMNLPTMLSLLDLIYQKKNSYIKKVQSQKSVSIIIGCFGYINNTEKQKNKLIRDLTI